MGIYGLTFKFSLLVTVASPLSSVPTGSPFGLTPLVTVGDRWFPSSHWPLGLGTYGFSFGSPLLVTIMSLLPEVPTGPHSDLLFESPMPDPIGRPGAVIKHHVNG